MQPEKNPFGMLMHAVLSAEGSNAKFDHLDADLVDVLSPLQPIMPPLSQMHVPLHSLAVDGDQELGRGASGEVHQHSTALCNMKARIHMRWIFPSEFPECVALNG